MARKSKKSSSNGKLETATAVLEIAAEAGSPELAEHGIALMDEYTGQDERPDADDGPDEELEAKLAEHFENVDAGIAEMVQANAQAKIKAIEDQVAAEIAEKQSTSPVVIVEGMASTPKPPVAERDPLQEKIYNLNEEAFNLKAEWERLAKLTKGKKGEWEETVDEIQRLIRATHESFPLFPDKPKPKPEPFEAAVEPEDEPEDDGAATILQIAQGTEGEDVAAVEDWKTIDVSALVAYGMPKKYVAILSEGGVHTIGDISALGDKHKSLTDIKGVGEAAETKINDALDGLWKARAEQEAKQAEVEAQEPDDAEPDDDYDGDPAAAGLAVAEDDAEAAGLDADEDDDFTPDFPDDETGEGFESEFADDGDTIDEMDPEGGEVE